MLISASGFAFPPLAPVNIRINTRSRATFNASIIFSEFPEVDIAINRSPSSQCHLAAGQKPFQNHNHFRSPLEPKYLQTAQ